MKIPSSISTTSSLSLYVRSGKGKNIQNPDHSQAKSHLTPALRIVRKAQDVDIMQLRSQFYNVLRNTEKTQHPELSFFKSLTPGELYNLSREELNQVVTYLHLELYAMPKEEKIPEIVEEWIASENQIVRQNLLPKEFSEKNGQIPPIKNSSSYLLLQLNRILQQSAQSSINSGRDRLAGAVQEIKIKIEETRKK